MSDDDLVRLAQSGDGAAFTALVERHAPACLRYATRMLGSPDDAEDVAQDAVVRAHRALDRYDGRVPFRTWLFAIVVNRCRSALAVQARRGRWFASGLVGEGRIGSHEDRTGLRVELGRALAAIPADQREAFLLKHVEGLEYTEMATMTGVGVSALKMRVQRACTQLRQQLADYEPSRRGNDAGG